MALSSRLYHSRMIKSLPYVLFGVLASLLLLKNNFFLSTDACLYAISGRNLVDLGFYPLTYAPPFYPVLIAGVYAVTGQLQWSAHLISVAAFALSILLFFRLAACLDQGKMAHIATFLYVSNGLILGYSYRALTHAVDLCLVVAYIFLAVMLLKNRGRRVVRAGLLGAVLAAAVLNRPEHLVTAGLLVPAIFVLLDARVRQKGLILFVLVAVMGTLLYPYALFIKKGTGRWGLTLKTANLRNIKAVRSREDPGHRVYEDQGFLDFELGSYIGRHKRALFGKYISGLRFMLVQFAGVLYNGLGLVLMGIGCVMTLRSPRERPGGMILLVCLSPLFLVVPFSDFMPRYYLSYLPVCLLFIARAADMIRHHQRLPRGSGLLVIGAVLVVLSCLNIHDAAARRTLSIQDPPREHIAMGRWMKQNIPGVNAALMASVKPFVAFYAESHYTAPPPASDYDTWLRSLQGASIDYLIADERYFIPAYPDFRFLLTEDRGLSGLKAVHVIREPCKIILYRVTPSTDASF